MLNAFIEDRQTRPQEEKRNGESQKAFPCFCRERIVTGSISPTPREWKMKMNFLSCWENLEEKVCF